MKVTELPTGASSKQAQLLTACPWASKVAPPDRPRESQSSPLPEIIGIQLQSQKEPKHVTTLRSRLRSASHQTENLFSKLHLLRGLKLSQRAPAAKGLRERTRPCEEVGVRRLRFNSWSWLKIDVTDPNGIRPKLPIVIELYITFRKSSVLSHSSQARTWSSFNCKRLIFTPKRRPTLPRKDRFSADLSCH